MRQEDVCWGLCWIGRARGGVGEAHLRPVLRRFFVRPQQHRHDDLLPPDSESTFLSGGTERTPFHTHSFINRRHCGGLDRPFGRRPTSASQTCVASSTVIHLPSFRSPNVKHTSDFFAA
uniref:Uncharacterized protein n=1 Tax=Plectus sambesii TaxID=2011161 RepID=A0A914WHP1_9BILA